MVFKMIKVGALSAAGLLVAGGLVFGTDLGSYVSSSTRTISTAVKGNVPIEFELRRARDLMEDILPEMQASIRAIAEQEVELDALRGEVAEGRKSLADERGQVAQLRTALAGGKAQFTLGHSTYTRDELKGDLVTRFDRVKEAELILAGKERLLGNREKSLQAAMALFEKTRSQRAMLENQIAALEGQHRLVKMASVGSGVQVDHSKLAQTEQLIAQIKKQLDVSERVLSHQAKFVQTLPLEPVVNEKDLLGEVDAYLSAPRGGAAEAANAAKADEAEAARASAR
jgi:hypothetical protein